MSLKDWIDNHPVAVIAGLVVSVASSASGVTGYLLNRLNEAQKIELTNKYNAQITDLTGRLTSIERRAGPHEKSYLDVQSLQVSVNEVKNLPAKYTSFDKGSFF